MKTKLTLLLGVLAFAGMSYADTFRYVPASNGKGGVVLAPVRDEATTSIALVKSSRMNSSSTMAATSNDSVKYVPASNGKGGISLVPVRGPATTSIALTKSCCAQH